MKSVSIVLAICLIWSASALAGFEWVAPAQNPSVVGTRSAPLAPAQGDAGLKAKDAIESQAQAEEEEEDDFDASALVQRIYDYEAGRITMQQQGDEGEGVSMSPSDNESGLRTLKMQDAETISPQPYAPPQGQSQTQYQAARPLALPEKSLDQVLLNPTEKPVVGFGTHMPLALSVNDIVPDHYSFSFGTDVNPGALVSWEGRHRPWTMVLQEVLSQQNLTATVQGNVVHIKISPAYQAYMQGAAMGAMQAPTMLQQQPQQQSYAAPQTLGQQVRPAYYNGYAAPQSLQQQPVLPMPSAPTFQQQPVAQPSYQYAQPAPVQMQQQPRPAINPMPVQNPVALYATPSQAAAPVPQQAAGYQPYQPYQPYGQQQQYQQPTRQAVQLKPYVLPDSAFALPQAIEAAQKPAPIQQQPQSATMQSLEAEFAPPALNIAVPPGPAQYVVPEAAQQQSYSYEPSQQTTTSRFKPRRLF